MANALDKSKPFGIIGGIFGVAKFEQDGNYFNARGELLDKNGEELKTGKKIATDNDAGKTAAKPKTAANIDASKVGKVGGTDPVGQQLSAQLGGD